MSRSGIAILPLHGGKAPGWLTGRMRRLAKEVSSILIDEYGTDMYLVRLSDPFWFQAFGCVLGYDWHSSGVTTVVTGVFKTALSAEEHGVVVCGGKDGVPYPVNCRGMNESIEILKATVQAAKLGDKEKMRALRGLRMYVPLDAQSS